MPGPAAHLSIIELQMKRTDEHPDRYATVGKPLNAFPEQARFGSIGPDMLFWADWNTYTPIVNAVFDVYNTLDEIYEKLAAIWEPIGKAIDKVENALTGGLAHAIQDTVALVKGIINTAMLDLITSKIDYWQTLKPHFQMYSPLDSEKNWNWLDYTHHRQTGAFTRRLIEGARASGDPAQQAYAYGWMSHVTADLVGHAYVNMAVGGPWRTHFQRHHLQENFMDVWTWGFYHTPGVTMPATPPGGLPFQYANFTNVGTADFHKLIDLGDDLPDNLLTLITGALDDIYRPAPHPTIIPFLGKDEINRAYQMQKLAFEIMTGKDRHLGPPHPPQFFGDYELPTYPTHGGSGSSGGSGGGGGGFSLSSLLAAIWQFIKDTLEYLADLALWLISKITSPLTYPVRYALYLAQLGLYEVYRAFRWALVVSGYVYPDPDQLADPFAQQFINPNPGLLLNTPRLEFPPERDHSHAYPLSGVEQPGVVAAPYGHGALNYPYWFIEGEPFDPDMEKALSAASSAEETADITLRFQNNVEGKAHYSGSLGNAVDLYLRRAAELHAAGGKTSGLLLPDWNIDADRGYAFKCWEALTKLEPLPAGGVKVKYL